MAGDPRGSTIVSTTIIAIMDREFNYVAMFITYYISSPSHQLCKACMHAYGVRTEWWVLPERAEPINVRAHSCSCTCRQLQASSND